MVIMELVPGCLPEPVICEFRKVLKVFYAVGIYVKVVPVGSCFVNDITAVAIAAALEDNCASYQMNSSVTSCMACNQSLAVTYF